LSGSVNDCFAKQAFKKSLYSADQAMKELTVLGILQINPLVSLKVLFQCKRYAGSVRAGHVRDFRGAMSGRADKGIIITTGSFTADAKREAIRDGVVAIELVDRDRLIEMLQRLELGLRPTTTYEVDLGFFSNFEDRG
jgi:restriction system protein